MANTQQEKELTPEQQQLLEERVKKQSEGVCVVCGEGTWFCGGIQQHLRNQK